MLAPKPYPVRSIAHACRLGLAASLAFAGTNAFANHSDAGERPADVRFAKTSLSKGEFFEPTEMAILPNLDVLIAQRRGEILHYDHSEKQVFRVAFLSAYFSSDAEGVNAEEGVLGLVADPDFARNNFIYIFYSPLEKSVNRLSRFVFKDNMLDMDSETVVLEFFSQRDICCHTGGSLAFGPDRLLYLSTGDNSTPFNERGSEFTTDGFSPLNDQSGKEQYDARRSAGNTNDLRGKILRIRILEDGTYEIPEGNLFPATDKTRPEIYTMGHRNPYRISVDKKTGTIYWGDVGPDATKDISERGPRGYDEMNRATEAGNYGWPLFVGDNYAYRDFDYSNGQSGPAFDPQSPINDSANNTGLKELPPANAPFIWYPYAESPEFPITGNGGRNAMAGPVYHKDLHPAATRLPDYYDGKVIMHDWIRNWFIAVKFADDGSIASIEPFLESLDFSGAIDVELGPDGRIYVLEYGSAWFQRNEDSGLSRIDFIEGNLPPKVDSLDVSKTTGKVPLSIKANAQVSDYENDPLNYTWHIGDKSISTSEPTLETELTQPGRYSLSLTATDTSGSQGTSASIEIYAGNERPELTIEVKGNQTFFFPEQTVSYSVKIKDDTRVQKENLFVSTTMARQVTKAPLGHRILSRAEEGKSIVSGSDCLACHKADEPSIGPSFTQIATRYAGQSGSDSILSNKILNGGGGAWGEVPMPAHPSLSETEVLKVVEYIRSHAPIDKSIKSLPAKGKIDPSTLNSTRWERILTINANYTDAPGSEYKELSATTSKSLLPNSINRFLFNKTEGFETDGFALVQSAKKAFVQLEDVDLRHIKTVELNYDHGTSTESRVSIHLDSIDGPEIGASTFENQSEATITLDRKRKPTNRRDLFISFELEDLPENFGKLQTITFSTQSR